MIWGGNPRSFPPAFSIKGFKVGGHTVLFSPFDLFTVLVVARADGAGCVVLFRRTDARAADARRGVRAGGLAAARRARRAACSRAGWALASLAGSLAGVLVAPAVFVAPTNFDAVLVFGFTAAVLGGLESPPGALVGGVLLGLALSYVSGYLGAEMVTLGALVILVAVLMVRPNGLFAARGDAACLGLPRHLAIAGGRGRRAVRAQRRAEPVQQPAAGDDGLLLRARSPG